MAQFRAARRFGLSLRQIGGTLGLASAELSMHWIDCHNHLQEASLGAAPPLLAAMAGAGVLRAVVNATCEAEWAAVAALAAAYPQTLVPAFGIHPWHAHEAGAQWQRRLRGLLEQLPQAGVGECGLDRWVAVPAVAAQVPVLVAQLRIARELQRTVTIHCVRAWGLLLETVAAEAPLPPFVLHSYSGSLEMARRLLPLGAYFSFSGRGLQPRQAAVLEVFRQLPRARILLETDAPEMLPPPPYLTHPLPGQRNHPANLPAIGGGLARALGMSAEALAELTTSNARACFGW